MHTRRGRPFVPSVGGVTTDNRMLDLGIRLAQASSCLGVGEGAPSPFFHPGSCKDRDALRGNTPKEGRVSEPHRAAVERYDIPSSASSSGDIACRERATSDDHDLLAHLSLCVSRIGGKLGSTCVEAEIAKHRIAPHSRILLGVVLNGKELGTPGPAERSSRTWARG